jgi:hypothetical protein
MAGPWRECGIGIHAAFMFPTLGITHRSGAVLVLLGCPAPAGFAGCDDVTPVATGLLSQNDVRPVRDVPTVHIN